MPVLTITEAQVEEAIGPLERYRHQCHAASLALVRSGLLPDTWRVARGWSDGIHGQHSWCIDGDPYSPDSHVLDVTAWSYTPRPRIWQAPNLVRHRPHGTGQPPPGPIPRRGAEVFLTGLEQGAQGFLTKRYPEGYSAQNLAMLVSGPVEGWPAAEIMRAMEAADLGVLIPVDVRAMVLEGGYR